MRPGSVNATSFDLNKAIAAIGHLVKQTGASMYPVMKMMYVADKLHLERYGRFIFGETYAAMEQGPVPSHAYNMVKHVRGDARHPEMELAKQHFAYQAQNHEIRLLAEPDLDELSQSDQQCLDEVIHMFHSIGQWSIRDMSHDPAWEAAWKGRRRLSKSSPLPIEQIAASLDTCEALLQHLRDTAPGEAVAAR